MSKCVYCGAETRLFIAESPVCIHCDEKHSEAPKKHNPSTVGCHECVRLYADYERSTTALDAALAEMLGVWDRSEYAQRRIKAEDARLLMRTAHTVLDDHLSTHGVVSAVAIGSGQLFKPKDW